MPDQKPLRLAGDERETLRAALQYVRESFVRKLGGIDDEAARWAPVGSGTSLLWLTRHLAYAESVWVLGRFAGRADDVPPNGVPEGDTLTAAVEAYRATWRAVDEVVASASLDDGCRADRQQPPVNLRWILVHLVEEIARHAGHADLIRELRDGSTGR
ncbi:MAG TPA: DinB family protein [Acidimicrobiales bacterium]|nr:DinB family protein [Acidimicrobiales bacterium]